MAQVESQFDNAAFRIKKRFGSDKPIQVVVYRTYGTKKSLYVKGRVLENKHTSAALENETLWNNIVAMYRRFASNEVRNARLFCEVNGATHETRSDDEGYFTFTISLEAPLSADELWIEMPVTLASVPFGVVQRAQALTAILIPDESAEYGIISDIDDTIVKTEATSLLRMSRNTFFNNAHSRLPFAGVAEFYDSLRLGRNGKRNNPFFYVSSSPWNLYDLLVDFMDINGLPEGPLLLRDFGLDEDRFSSSDHMGHKYKEISRILDTYPDLKFVLVGDSGQDDPKIYSEVVKNNPGRILSIYIRDVQLPEREKIAVQVKETLTEKVQMLIVDTTIEAAKHAAAHGLIFSEGIPAIEQDKALDTGEVSGKEPID